MYSQNNILSYLSEVREQILTKEEDLELNFERSKNLRLKFWQMPVHTYKIECENEEGRSMTNFLDLELSDSNRNISTAWADLLDSFFGWSNLILLITPSLIGLAFYCCQGLFVFMCCQAVTLIVFAAYLVEMVILAW